MCFGRSLKGDHANDLTNEPARVVNHEKTSSRPTTPSNAPVSAKLSETPQAKDASSTANESTASRPKQGYNSFLGADPGAMRGKDFGAMGGVLAL